MNDSATDTPVPLIVVPCLNEALYIGPLVLMLLRARVRLGGRVVVADGGSTDGSQAIVAEIADARDGLDLIHNPERIQSAGINLAVERFGEGATHLIRIDAHCAYPEDYCDLLLDEARRTGAASVVVSLRAEGRGIFQRAIAAAQNAPVGNGGSAHRLESQGAYVDHGHHALIELSAFRAVGGYDSRFSHNEDAEFDHRLTRAGHEIWLTGLTRATYFPRSGYRKLERQYYNYGAGRALNLLKHRMLPKVRQAKVIAILPVVMASSLAPVHFAFALPLAAWMAYCAAMAAALALRERDPSLLVAAPAAMVMHLAWSLGFWSTVVRRPAFAGARPA